LSGSLGGASGATSLPAAGNLVNTTA